MNNLISVIIPTHGGSKVIGRALNSVLNQTYKNVEIIVVDDNGLGTPEQMNTAKEMLRYHDEIKVKYICHDINRNGSVARNTGVKASNGALISLLDDDDEFYPTKLEILESTISALPEEYALVYGNAKGIDGSKIVYYNKAYVPDNPLYNILLHRFSIGTSTFLMKRECYDGLGGFDEDFKRHQDWEFFARVVAKYRIQSVDTLASIRHMIRRHSFKATDTLVEMRKFYLERMKPYISLLPIEQQKDVVVYNTLDVAIKYLREKRYKDFIRCYKQLKPGFRGLLFFYRRAVTIIKRGFIKRIHWYPLEK